MLKLTKNLPNASLDVDFKGIINSKNSPKKIFRLDQLNKGLFWVILTKFRLFGARI